MQKAVFITGVNGGIGLAIAERFLQEGYAVYGVDVQPAAAINLNSYWSVDLAELVDKPELQKELEKNITSQLEQKKAVLKGLVNNAAVQILGDTRTVSMTDFLLSQTVNVAAPLLVSKLCLSSLKIEQGMIINIGSIHASLTKPEFISYATSKAAIKGLTQAMAVDLAGEVRVNCIEPAAVATNMLIDGFKACPDKLKELEACHPSGQIGTPEEVAELCYFLVDSKVTFLNGTCIGLNGGIAARLHDPV